jgi:cell division protein FtsQ
MRWKKILYVFLWSLASVAVLLSLAFVEVEQSKVLCKNIIVRVNQDHENYFINKEDIYKIIYSSGDSLKGKPLSWVNLRALEAKINTNKYIEHTEVSNDLTGNVMVVVKQRKPVLRIINLSHNSFYIDENGGKMPLSDNYTADVLIANGNITESYGGIYDSVISQQLKDIVKLAFFINADAFWNMQVEQIFIEPDGDFVLIPRLGDHKIVFGDISLMEEKFSNLMTFYTKALPKTGWDVYSVINVKFKGQIVGVKNSMKVVVPAPAADTAATDTLKKEVKI